MFADIHATEAGVRINHFKVMECRRNKIALVSLAFLITTVALAIFILILPPVIAAISVPVIGLTLSIAVITSFAAGIGTCLGLIYKENLKEHYWQSIPDVLERF